MNQLSIVAAARRLHDRVNFRGLPVSIENRKGSIRQGVSKKGKAWQTFIRTPYGYLRGTVGVDGDHVDVFVGPNLDAANVYVVHTRNLETGGYDEDKCMLGFMTPEAAKYEFIRNYDKPDHFGSMTTVPFEQFRKNVLGGEYKGKKILAYETSDGVKKEWDTRGRKTFDQWTQKEKNLDWAERHKLPIDEQDRVRLYHATPLATSKIIAKTGLKDGSFLTDDVETAMQQAGRDRGLKAGKLATFEAWVPLGRFHGSTWASTIGELSPSDLSLKIVTKGQGKILAEGLSIGDEVVVNGIQYRMVVKGFRGKLVLLESKGQFNQYHPRTILRTMREITKI